MADIVWEQQPRLLLYTQAPTMTSNSKQIYVPFFPALGSHYDAQQQDFLFFSFLRWQNSVCAKQVQAFAEQSDLTLCSQQWQ